MSEQSVEHLVALVEEAKSALVAAVPSPRGVPGRPLAEALAAFEERLREATAASGGQAEPFGAAIAESLRRAERLRLEAPQLDYEALVTVLAELLAPLDAFEDLGQSTRRR